MSAKTKSKAIAAKKDESFWTFSNVLLTILVVIGILCLIALIGRAVDRSRRSRETSESIVIRPVEPKPSTPTRTPTPGNPPPTTPIARLLSKEEDLKRTEDKVGEGDDSLPPFPDDTSDKHGRRESLKKYCHALSRKLIDSAKLPDVLGYSSARDYILTCKGGSSYYAACCKVRSAMEDYNWKATSLLTYCKGGGLSKPKKNYNRQAKVARKKRAQQKDWHGVGLLDPERLT